ncbi:MAG: DEAD/DEAH box helicase family protein [Thermotogota bacterium]|nr:DEAD/DEAH box helicase family protein [Thermotogota bacterium]
MARVLLQDTIEDSRKFEDLPPSWNSFDLETFSKSKKLWDYQQKATENAINVLCKYFEDFVDYQAGESLEKTQERKQRFFQWYEDNGLEEDLSIKLDKRKRNVYNLLTTYYPQDNEGIPYEHLINRMCFWMATGSGKSLVILKLIQVLKALIERGEIPPWDILVLTHRDDLIQQLKRHVDEFNYANDEIHIRLRELKEYPGVKRQQTLFRSEEITVFYYRSDNLSDEQKEKIIDFRNYDNDGKWYIFLDEAHKGDKEESKRQHIYSILSRNGFLFNSSATFIDDRDIITCAYEFNLSSFINAGYGKHIAILKQETKAFRDDEDYSGEEKQKIVLKSLILLTYVKSFYEDITKIQKELYHNPLLLTLVNSVNTEDADLKLFFRELERIGKGDVEQELFNSALGELWQELKQEPDFMFEDGNKVRMDEAGFKSITTESVLRYIYNSATSGEIEILVRPSNRKELAFKLKTSDKPFALIKIGDVSSWLKGEFAGYEVNERFEDETYFESLNREDSTINILMGSRSFYEGWDSNRPNVINYINIGIGEDARKFILQSVGRGVRIEPIKDERKRLLSLYNAKEVSEALFNKIKHRVLPLETLFIFGTNRSALQVVIQGLQNEKKRAGEAQQLSLFVNSEVQKHKLLVPTYKQAEQPIFKERKGTKFEISKAGFEVLNKFIKFIPDDRVFLMRYNTEPVRTKLLRDNLSDQSNFRFGERSFKNVDLLAQRIFEYFGLTAEEFKELKELKEEIKHFKNIKVTLEDISEIQRKVESVKDYPSQIKELRKQYGKISAEEYMQMAQNLKNEEDFETNHKKIKIKYVANHYYIPLILSDEERLDYIKHIIKTPSEVKFIDDMEGYLARSDNKFKEFDWWLFSKLDESLDEVYIPYYNPNINRISYFYPDFIFWLVKGNEYFIVFVDPKGTEHTGAYRKVDGYKELFEENGREKGFAYNGSKVKIKLRLRPEDVSKALVEYKQYWFDDIGKMLETVGSPARS